MRRFFGLALLAACAAAPTAEEPLQGVVIEGAVQVPPAVLQKAARQELGAFLERGRRPADAADAAYAMELELRERGYAQARVEFTVETTRLLFRVTEGPRFRLGRIAFEGVESFPVEKIREDFFGFRGAGAFDTGAPVFVRSELDAAAEELEHFYLLEGFFRVDVEDPHVVLRAEEALADVTVVVREGRRYRVAALEGDLPEGLALEVAGKPYHVRVPAQVEARVRAWWRERGHQFVQADAVAERDDETGAVVLRLAVQPGPLVRLHEMKIEGGQRTRPRFLHKRVPFRPDDVLYQAELRRAIDELYRTRLFSAVRHRLEPHGEDRADLRIDLEELEARSVDFELGYGSYELARGAVRYRDRNLLGIGRRLQIEGHLSVRGFGTELRIEDPWLLGSHTTVELATRYGEREEPTFDRITAGFSLALRHRRKDSPYTLREGYRIRAEEARNVTGAIPPVDEEGFLRTAGVFASLVRDTRDDVLAPLNGSLARVALLWSSPSLGADLDFLEIDTSASVYKRLGERTVLALGFRVVTREILDDRPNLPIQERLFLGGESSVRSFREDDLGPADATGEPVGGLTSAEASVELRRHLWRDLYGALFYDVGMIDLRPLSVSGPPGHAVGFGLRWLLPIGPIRLDAAYNPGRLFAADDYRWAIHLAVGFSF